MVGGAEVHEDELFDEPPLSRRAWLPSPRLSAQAPSETNLAEHVASQIEKLAAEREPGTRLGSKDDLREFVGVSVGTINEALRIAQARGGITLRRGPGGGIFAAPTSSLARMGSLMLGMETDERTIADALRMRDALDPMVIADAITNVTERDLADLAAMNTAIREGLSGTDMDEYIHAHWAFQARVAGISPNPLLRTVFISLLGILDEQTVAVFPPGTDLEREIEIRLATHEHMVEALRSRDLSAALGLKGAHLASEPEFVRRPSRQIA